MTLAEELSVASWYLPDERAGARLLWSSQVRGAPAPHQGVILPGGKTTAYTLTKASKPGYYVGPQVTPAKVPGPWWPGPTEPGGAAAENWVGGLPPVSVRVSQPVWTSEPGR